MVPNFVSQHTSQRCEWFPTSSVNTIHKGVNGSQLRLSTHFTKLLMVTNFSSEHALHRCEWFLNSRATQKLKKFCESGTRCYKNNKRKNKYLVLNGGNLDSQFSSSSPIISSNNMLSNDYVRII